MLLESLAPILKNKSILITGGSGFFGKSLCEALDQLNKNLELGMIIYALGRKVFEHEGIKFIQHDVTQPLNFDLKINFIIHAANPVGSDDTAFDKNIDIIVNGTNNVLNFAEKMKADKVLLVSSGAIYGEQPETVAYITEDFSIVENFFDFNSAYKTGKRISELLAIDWCNRTGRHLTVARCFAFSGKFLPVDSHLAVGNFIGDALRQKLINVKGDGSAVRSYMDADDLVNWLMTILLKGSKGEFYNVGSDTEVTIKELAGLVAQAVPGTEVKIQNTQSFNGKRSRYVPSIEKAKKSLHLKISVDLNQSIQKMLEFNKGIIR